jgi:hypothetical protein
MMREASVDAVKRVSAYMAARKMLGFNVVGNGLYGLVAVYDDGHRALEWMGFETAFDAELWQVHVEALVPTAVPTAESPMVAPMRAICAAHGLTVAEAGAERTRLRFEIVALAPAVSSASLDALQLESGR